MGICAGAGRSQSHQHEPQQLPPVHVWPPSESALERGFSAFGGFFRGLFAPRSPPTPFESNPRAAATPVSPAIRQSFTALVSPEIISRADTMIPRALTAMPSAGRCLGEAAAPPLPQPSERPAAASAAPALDGPSEMRADDGGHWLPMSSDGVQVVTDGVPSELDPASACSCAVQLAWCMFSLCRLTAAVLHLRRSQACSASAWRSSASVRAWVSTASGVTPSRGLQSRRGTQPLPVYRRPSPPSLPPTRPPRSLN